MSSAKKAQNKDQTLFKTFLVEEVLWPDVGQCWSSQKPKNTSSNRGCETEEEVVESGWHNTTPDSGRQARKTATV